MWAGPGRPTLPMAERTTHGSCSGKAQMMAATFFMRSAVATDDPPNL